MGLIVSQRSIERAAVAAIHYSKNVELRGGYTAQYVIGELERVELNERFDLTKAKFANSGKILYGYAVSNSFVFYDKVADLRKDGSRAIDKDTTIYQQGLFNPLNRACEMLRFEVRLSEKRTMNAVFEATGFSKNPTFLDAFSEKRSQAALLHYWDKITKRANAALFAYMPAQQDVLKQVTIRDSSAKGKQAIYLAGLVGLARTGGGLRELRAVLMKRCDERTWQRIRADFKSIAAKLEGLRPREWFDQVSEGIKSREPVRIARLAYVNKSKV
jgi:hypothetical protein